METTRHSREQRRRFQKGPKFQLGGPLATIRVTASGPGMESALPTALHDCEVKQRVQRGHGGLWRRMRQGARGERNVPQVGEALRAAMTPAGPTLWEGELPTGFNNNRGSSVSPCQERMCDQALSGRRVATVQHGAQSQGCSHKTVPNRVYLLKRKSQELRS